MWLLKLPKCCEDCLFVDEMLLCCITREYLVKDEDYTKFRTQRHEKCPLRLIKEHDRIVKERGDVTPFAEASPEMLARVSNDIQTNELTPEDIYDKYGWTYGDEKEIELRTGDKMKVCISGFSSECLEPVKGWGFSLGEIIDEGEDDE